MRRIVSTLVLALMVFPLAAPLLDAFVAQAQLVGVAVYNRAVAPGAEIAFYVDRQFLAAGPTMFFFLSNNSVTQIMPGDQLIGSVTVPPDTKFVVGTLLMPTTITVLGTTMFLKVSTGNQPPASAVVSNATTLIRDEVRLRGGIRLTENRTVNPADIRDLAFFNSSTHGFADFALHNKTKFIINLTHLGVAGRLNVAGLHINISLASFPPCPNQPELEVFNRTGTVGSNFLYTSNLRFSVSADGRVANFTGRVGNFTLRCPSSVRSVAGVDLAFQRFNLNLAVANGTISVGTATDNIVVVRRGTPGEPQSGPVTFPRLVISAGVPDRVSIYPSVRFSFADNPANPFNLETKRITPGDFINIALHNFRSISARPLSLRIFVRDGALFSPVASILTDAVTIPASGPNAGHLSATNIARIPAAPFGGRPVIVTANVTGADVPLAAPNFAPALRVLPGVQVFGFNKEGNLVLGQNNLPRNDSTIMVPGEIFAVRGVGYFNASGVVVDLLNESATPPASIAPTRLAFRAFPNGSFVGIFQIPPALRLYNGQTVRVRAYFGPAGGFNSHNFTDPVAYPAAADARVMIDPRIAEPSLNSTSPVARIALGGEKFPFAAGWEAASARVFSLLVYGAAQGDLRFNVSLLGPATPTLLLNVTRNGTGSLLLPSVAVPSEPGGFYQARVVSGANTYSSSAEAAKQLRIQATAAAQDPSDLAFKKSLFLAVPANITVRGLAFDANRAVRYDIPQIGLNDIDLPSGAAQASTNAKGEFIGFINLPQHNLQPGSYVIRLETTSASATISVTVGVPPPFRIDLIAESSPFVEAPVDVWVMAFYGGSLAQLGQISSVSVNAYLRVGATTRQATVSVSPALAPSAIYYGSFDPIAVFGADARGKVIALVAEVRAKFVPIAREDVGVDVESIFVPTRSLRDEINAALKANLSALESLISLVRSQIATNLSAIRSDLASFSAGVRANLTAIRALLVTVNEKADAQIAALITANDRISAVASALSRMNVTMVSGFAAVRTDIAGLASLMRAMNASLRDVVVSESGTIRAAIVAGRDAIIGVVRANASAIAALVRAVDSSVKSVSDALAAFRSEATSRMDTILAEVGRARTDIAAVGAGVTTAQSVLAEVRTTLSTVNDRVVGIRSVVDSVNAAMAGVATKSELAAARDAVNSRVAAAESSLTARVAALQSALGEARASLEGQIQSSQDALLANDRNWGIINSVLVIIAIALLAYSLFVARRP